MKDWLSTGDLAKVLRVSNRKAAEILDSDKLYCFKVGQNRRTTPQAVHDFMVAEGFPADWIEELKKKFKFPRTKKVKKK